MRSEKVAPFSAVTDPRIAKIEQMTLEESPLLRRE
jgi:hypothetical protein